MSLKTPLARPQGPRRDRGNFLGVAPREPARAGCYVPRVRPLLPALAIVLTGCLSPNPSFDDEAPTDALQTSAADASGPSDPGAETSTGGPPSDATATTIAGTTDGLTGATTSAPGGMSATTTDATTGAENSTTAGVTEATTGGEDAPACPDDPRLALCFEFDDAATGVTVVPDGSGNANDGLAIGLELTDGPWGQALVASESLELKIDDSDSLDITNRLTIELQVALAQLPDEDLVRTGLLHNQGQYGLFVLDSGALECRVGGTHLSGAALPIDVWTHVACTVTADAMRLYVDGELVAEGEGATLKTESEAPIAVANSSPDWVEATLGALDRVHVWSDALTQAELCALAGPDCQP